MEGLPTIPPRLEIIRMHKGQGGAVAAVLPIHYSRSLLRAFEILPVEVWGPPGMSFNHGATHLQAYICSIVHNALSFLQSGGLEVADLLIVPHACDSLQGLGSILLDFVKPKQPVIPIYIPRGCRESDILYLADELRAVYDRLQVITGRTPGDEELMHCVRREEAADGLLAELHQERLYLPLENLAFYRLVRSREYLPAEKFTELAQAVLAGNRDPTSGSIPILLSGILPEPLSLLETLTKLGAVVAADDFACCGRRLYPPGESDQPFYRMAERILHGPPDSTRGHSIEARRDHLLKLVDASGSRGVIFYEIKFCEPELFDLPLLRKELRDKNIPTISIEIDINDPLSQQVFTRLEAFLEMIQ